MERTEMVRTAPRPNPWWWVGMVGPVLFTVSWGAESFLVPGTDPWTQSISFLGQGPWGWVQNDNFVVSGLLVLVFVGVLYAQSPGGPPRLRSLARWQSLAALGMVLAGLVRQRARSPALLTTPFGPITSAGLGHIAGSALVYLAVVGASGLEGWAAAPWSTEAWRWWSRVTATGLVTGLGLFLITAADDGPSGLWERVVALMASVWMVAWVRRTQRMTRWGPSPGSTPPSDQSR
ncbi:MAG: DUF998 domain-containing protein [Thermaerobacter sp.]|nr:DUF998 domain-containing protein [Thermaerobacter sp.]